jgi:hypothetical protein
MVADIKKIAATLSGKNNNYQITTLIDPLGEHNEKNWRR